MPEIEYEKILSRERDLGFQGLQERSHTYTLNGEYLYSTEWSGDRPRIVKVPMAWAIKVHPDPGGKDTILVLYQAECHHAVRGERSFKKWSELTEDQQMEAIPRCDRCVAEIDEIEWEEYRTKRASERKERRQQRIESMKNGFRKIDCASSGKSDRQNSGNYGRFVWF